MKKVNPGCWDDLSKIQFVLNSCPGSLGYLLHDVCHVYNKGFIIRKFSQVLGPVLFKSCSFCFLT